MIDGREIDAVTARRLIQAKRSHAALDNPRSFIKNNLQQILATIALAPNRQMQAEFWFKYDVSPIVERFIDNRGGIVKTCHDGIQLSIEEDDTETRFSLF